MEVKDLIQTLRENFKTPQEVLEKLGIDTSKPRHSNIVGDSKHGVLDMSGNTHILTRKGAVVLGALVGFLKPKLATDAAINFYPALNGVTTKNFGKSKPKIVKAITEQCKGKLAKDASVDGLVELLDGLEKVEGGTDDDPLATKTSSALPMGGEEDDEEDMGDGDADAHAGLRAFLEEKGMDPADIEKACAMVGGGGDEDIGTEAKSEEGLDEEVDMEKIGEAKDKRRAKDEPPPFKAKPEVGKGPPGMSKDEVNKAIKVATDKAIEIARKEAAATREAERYVRPWVGDLDMAHDSAEGVFRTTLTALGVEGVDKIHPSAYRAILDNLPRPGERRAVREDLGMDSAGSADLAKKFPGLAKLKVM